MKTIAQRFCLCLCILIMGSQCSTARWDATRSYAWQKRPVSYAKTKLWNKRHLTWRVESGGTTLTGLSKEALCTEVEKSFKSWEPAGVFTFAQAAQGEPADITITFDPPPGQCWDGQLGTMGHAAFPWAANRGRIYLDPSEWWSAGSFSLLGDRITEWLPHEIGHVLGLQHTHKPGDMMCATGPYDLPDTASFSRLRHIYAPNTPVIALSSYSTAASKSPRPSER